MRESVLGGRRRGLRRNRTNGANEIADGAEKDWASNREEGRSGRQNDPTARPDGQAEELPTPVPVSASKKRVGRRRHHLFPLLHTRQGKD